MKIFGGACRDRNLHDSLQKYIGVKLQPIPCSDFQKKSVNKSLLANFCLVIKTFGDACKTSSKISLTQFFYVETYTIFCFIG